MANEKQLILVETVKITRARYLVEVPVDEPDWALDVVTCNDAKTVSEKFLDETIVSHMPITRDALLSLASSEGFSEDALNSLVTKEVDYARKN